MSTTVYFATNRVVTNANVDGINIATNASGVVSQIKDVNKGGFSPDAIDALSNRVKIYSYSSTGSTIHFPMR